MKSSWIIAVIGVVSLVAVSCSLPVGPKSGASTSTTTAGSQATSGSPTSQSLSLIAGSNGGDALLIGHDGFRVKVASVTSDGSTVVCTTPGGITPLKAGHGDSMVSEDSTALIVGTTASGSPGAWIYTGKKVEGLDFRGDGKIISKLPQSGGFNGVFRGRFGWVYHIMGFAADGKGGAIIVGYAVNTKGFHYHGITIDPNTKIGVYWMISEGHWRHHFEISEARVIGIYKSTSPSLRNEDHKGGNRREYDRHDRGHRWHRDRFDHARAQLSLLLLGQLTDYLTTVDAKGASYDSTKDVYLVKGQDQNGVSASATISERGKIAITAAPTTKKIDLSPGKVTYVGGPVVQGGTLPVTLELQNLDSGSVSSSFTVDFYYATSSSFSPSPATKVGSATVASIGGNASISVNATLTMPTLSSSEAIYLYADVDPAGTTGDVNTANNISTLANAAGVLTYVTTTPRTYGLYVETYSPDGTNTMDTGVVLCKENSSGTGMTVVDSDVAAGSGFVTLNETSTGNGALAPGTYYIGVASISSAGPYVLDVYSSNLSGNLPSLTPLTADPNAGADGSPTFGFSPPVGTSYSLPAAPQTLQVGNALNWYFPATSEYDWFEFTLP